MVEVDGEEDSSLMLSHASEIKYSLIVLKMMQFTRTIQSTANNLLVIAILNIGTLNKIHFSKDSLGEVAQSHAEGLLYPLSLGVVDGSVNQIPSYSLTSVSMTGAKDENIKKFVCLRKLKSFKILN